MQFDQELDARGLACPMPIVKTKKALAGMGAGKVLKIVATDPGSVSDMKAFAEATGHELLASDALGKEYVFFVRN
jgi:tRNA 2-thiouridine synthesizing protein A